MMPEGSDAQRWTTARPCPQVSIKKQEPSGALRKEVSSSESGERGASPTPQINKDAGRLAVATKSSLMARF